MQSRPLGREVLQIKTPRFVQWTIFVTSNGALTTIKSFEHEKPPGWEGSSLSTFLSSAAANRRATLFA
jgi:hypothetical protein